MLLHLLRAQAERGRLYALAFLEDGPLVGEAARLGHAVHMQAAGRLRDSIQFGRTVLALARWLRRVDVAAVLSWMPKAHLYASLAARLAGVAASWFQHGIPDGHWLDRWATRLPARSVLCCSRASQRAQDRLSPRRPSHVIYPAVRVDPLVAQQPPARARAALGLRPSEPLVGIVARLQRWKGVHVFVDAAARVAAVRADVRFLVVGAPHFSEPQYPGELQEQARRAGIASRIHFAGGQPDAAPWMAACDVVVHASVAPEPFGMVVCEAMALGRVAVASAAGGPLEIVAHGVNGMLFRPGDAEGLAYTILAALQEGPARASMQRAGQERAAQFTPQRLAEAVEARLQ